jgi:hypothetical protein
MSASQREPPQNAFREQNLVAVGLGLQGAPVLLCRFSPNAFWRQEGPVKLSDPGDGSRPAAGKNRHLLLPDTHQRPSPFYSFNNDPQVSMESWHPGR